MRTNIEIDDDLMAEAMRATGARTKRGAVEIALKSAVQLGRQVWALKQLWGLGWDGDLEELRTDKPLQAVG